MKLTILTLVGTALIMAPVCLAVGELEEVPSYLNGGDTITTHNGQCQLRLYQNGNLLTQRYDPWHEDYRVTWKTGPFGGEEGFDFYAELSQEDGSISIGCVASEDQLVRNTKLEILYSTVPYAQPDYLEPVPYISYRLVMDYDCLLSVLGTYWDEVDQEEREVTVWKNIKRGLTNKDVLQKGDILAGFHQMEACNSTKDYSALVDMHVILQHNCQLREYVGRDMAARSLYDGSDQSLVWEAEYEADAPVQDCYVYIDEDFVGLFEGKFDKRKRDITYPERTGLLWRSEYDYVKHWEETEVHDDNGFFSG